MPWRGVTVSEQRLRFPEDYQLNYYSVTDLAERFSNPRKTPHYPSWAPGKWINRLAEYGRILNS